MLLRSNRFAAQILIFKSKDTKQSIKDQIKQAAKYVLCFDGILYLSKDQKLSGVNLTEDINDAQIFAYGFDSPEDKTQIWSYSLKRQLNNNMVYFQAKNI